MNTMKLLHFTDLHNSYGFIEKLKADIEQADGIVISGDITTFGPIENAQKAVSRFKELNANLMIIPGNCDTPEVKKYLESSGFSIDRKVISFEGYQWMGIGGSLPCPTLTPNQYTECEYQKDLEELKQSCFDNKKMILVSHHPPYKTKNDRVEAGLHVGSEKIREFIEKEQPSLCLCGHIHEGRGVDQVGQTTVVNPGPAMNGCYAEITLTGESVSVELRTV